MKKLLNIILIIQLIFFAGYAYAQWGWGPTLIYTDETNIFPVDVNWGIGDGTTPISSITTDSLSDGSLTITGGRVTDVTEIVLGLPSDGFNFYNSGTGAYVGFGGNAESQLYLYGSNYGAILDVASLSADRIFKFPNIAGTLVTTAGALSDIDIGAYILEADTLTDGVLTINAGNLTTTGTLGAGVATITGGMDINLAADDNITIDGRTNPRTVTIGAMRWNHTPDASTPNTRALFLDIDTNSVPNTQGMHIDLKGTSLAAGETIIGVNIVGDTANSSGGVIRLLELDKTGVGGAEVHGIHIEPEIEEVIHHASGVFIDPTQGWIEVNIGGGFTDTTVAFSSSGNDVTIFAADDDAIYIGAEAVFQEVEVVMNTGASNPGIKPTFAIWTGSWTTITPIDNTAGFRESGLIDMEDSDLSSWVANTVNSVSKFYLRITRTQANLNTDPIEDLIQTAAVTDYIWDKDGNLNINSLTGSGAGAFGTLDTGQGANELYDMNQNVTKLSNVDFGTVGIFDFTDEYYLNFTATAGKLGAADKSLQFNVNDANRILTFTGNATLNQDVSTTGDPTFSILTTATTITNGLVLNELTHSKITTIVPRVNASGGGTLTIDLWGSDPTLYIQDNGYGISGIDQDLRRGTSPVFADITLDDITADSLALTGIGTDGALVLDVVGKDGADGFGSPGGKGDSVEIKPGDGGDGYGASAGDGGDITLSPGVDGDIGGGARDGLIIIDQIPTSNPSVSGALWNDGGIIKMSTGS